MLNWIVLDLKDFSVCLILCIYNLCTEQHIGNGGGGGGGGAGCEVHERALASVSIYVLNVVVAVAASLHQ